MRDPRRNQNTSAHPPHPFLSNGIKQKEKNGYYWKKQVTEVTVLLKLFSETVV